MHTEVVQAGEIRVTPVAFNLQLDHAVDIVVGILKKDKKEKLAESSTWVDIKSANRDTDRTEAFRVSMY